MQSNWLHAEAWQVALGAMNIHVDRGDLRRQIGKGGDELIPAYVPWWKEKHVEKPLKALRRHIFQQMHMHQVQPVPRARDFLLRAVSRSTKTSVTCWIVSSKAR